MKNVQLLLGLVFASFALHGMEQVEEWTGLRKYWYKNDFRLRYHPDEAYVYQYCKNRKNDPNCAVINAYFLLEAREKEYAQQRVDYVKMNISKITKEIDATEIAIAQEVNFVNKSKLQNDLVRLQVDKKNYMQDKNNRKKKVLSIDTQLKMGNLSGLQDKCTHKKLEDSFNAIVPSEKIFDQRNYLQWATKHAQKRDESGRGAGYQ